MLQPGIRRHRRSATSDNLRFECWSLAQAMRLAQLGRSDLLAGTRAALNGAPCPGRSMPDAFRLGWELGAVHIKRVPWPRCLTELNAQAADIGASAVPAPVTIH